ncbi:HAD family hydrolase [Microlunatus elymi]|uniref:HAD family hydrolase n=1 Tax=Microlunatus elymi TaxID=2596828 RepID=UPI00143D4CB7|nr:HAD-IA family hydrolase [Microlunatus elymi]
MTTNPSQILAETTAVFLDFDGPVTHLFADGRNQAIADRMRSRLEQHQQPANGEAATTADPLAVLRWAYDHCTPDAAADAEQTCIDGEVQAAGDSDPAPGSTVFIRACRASGRPLIIVSNNSADAIHAYLERLKLSDQVDAVVGRVRGDPYLMKPNRHLIDQALQLIGSEPSTVAFIGDSVSDVEVGELTGLRTIGYAKRPDRRRELGQAGAQALTTTIGTLADSISEFLNRQGDNDSA